ncbi:alpha/beta fold hydrolase [Porticoccus sp. GXU_MW_L64]
MADQKPSLILVPGILCDEWVWQHQVKALANVVDIAVADLRGHNCLSSMAEAILQQAPDQFALAGHSMGGRVALEMMRLAPQRITRLALLDTGVHSTTEAEYSKRSAQNQTARQQGMGTIVDSWIAGMVHSDRVTDTALISGIRDMLLRMTPQDLANMNTAMLSRSDATPLLAQISCPTLFLCGRQDSYSPLVRHRQMAAMVPGARLAVIEGCGHMTTLERPHEVTACLRNWLSE